MRKNKKRIDPRYFLNETFEPEPMSTAPDEIGRNVYVQVRDSAGRDFFNTSEADYEMISAAMPGSRVIDPNNYSQVNSATQSRDPQTIIPLGVHAQYLYFKTANDVYLRIPASGA